MAAESMNQPLVVEGATAMLPSGPLEDAVLVARDGRIAAVGSAAEVRVPPDARRVPAAGLLLAPGLIELQINGGFGHDFTARPDTVWEVAARLPAHGVTTFLPTIITSPPGTADRAREVLAGGAPGGPMDARGGATPLGLHIEGPFIHPAAAGAHDRALLREPDADARRQARDWTVENGVRLVTLAPELPGALELIEQLVEQGVRVSAGHSTADYTAGEAGIEAGIRYATHLFNAMPPLGHREPGLVGALLADPRVTLGMIPDGIHVHPAIVELVFEAAGARFSAVTDATAGLGMAGGSFVLAGQAIVVDDSSVRLATDGRLAGSALAPDEALRRLHRMTGCSAAAALATMTSVPARLLGLDDRGQLVVGSRADVVLFTPELEVVATFIDGQSVHGQWS
jgi:N-acetylglucosamine-6-phosphate deacetylase